MYYLVKITTNETELKILRSNKQKDKPCKLWIISVFQGGNLFVNIISRVFIYYFIFWSRKETSSLPTKMRHLLICPFIVHGLLCALKALTDTHKKQAGWLKTFDVCKVRLFIIEFGPHYVMTGYLTLDNEKCNVISHIYHPSQFNYL